MLSKGMIAVARVTSIESKVANRGGSILALNRPCRQGFLAAAGLRRGVLSGSGGDGWTAHDEAIRPSEGVLGKDCKEKMVEQRGARTFIDVESGGWPVHAPCPKQRVAKPGEANRSTEIIY